MKKETVLYGIIVILLITIAVGITYIVMDNKNNNNNDTKVKENNKNKVQEKNTLTEEEINKYLNYVPLNFNYNVYKEKQSNINNIPKQALISEALKNELSCWDNENCPFDMNLKIRLKYELSFNYEGEFIDRYYFPFDYIKNKVSENYNISIDNLEETKTKDDMYEFGLSFIFQSNYFLSLGGGIYTQEVSYIDSYEVNDELIIYEYHAYYYDKTLNDYYNNYEIELEDDPLAELKNNKDKFTKYKHTFKAKDNGYYYYSSEVVS